MRNSLAINKIEYKSQVASSLYEVILEKAANECSRQLFDLLGIACDLNQSIHKDAITIVENMPIPQEYTYAGRA
ncbi:MAG TPA: hypothetical protein ACHBZ9_08135 [Arsenophonus nasoniae]|uniref:hypothetical protein n=1 Tax=Arsenophonus nasoniae TaxID=638 RepID=UPI00387A05A2